MLRQRSDGVDQRLRGYSSERVTGIEPALSAWETRLTKTNRGDNIRSLMFPENFATPRGGPLIFPGVEQDLCSEVGFTLTVENWRLEL